MHYVVFCDEFGNTGGQLLPTEQLVLVYAFVIVDPSRVDCLGDFIRELYRKENLVLTEIKSSTLVVSRRGLTRYAAIGEILSRLGARVCLSVVEKRYQVCAMIAETYLDPACHECAPPEMLDRRFRQKFVDACYQSLSDAQLMDFLEGVSSDDPAGIAECGKRLSETLQFHPDRFVAYTASCIESRPEDVFRYAQRRIELPQNAHVPASQYCAFYPGVQCVEAYLSQIDASGDLVHDEDAQFGEALGLAFALGRGLDRDPDARLYGATQLVQLQSCRTGSSAKELGIQVADLAAGLFGRVTQNLVDRQALPTKLRELMEVWRGILAPSSVHYWMVSDAKLPTVLSGIFGSPMLYGWTPPWTE